MHNLYTVLDTAAGLNLFRSYVLPIGFHDNIVTLAHLPPLNVVKRRPLHLLGMIVLRLWLVNAHFRAPFMVTRQFAATIIIGTESLDRRPSRSPHPLYVECGGDQLRNHTHGRLKQAHC